MNYMQANPEKFQFIIFDKERQPRTLQLNHNVTIQSVSNVKLLGVNIDVELNFNRHIALLCNKAGRQINAVSRLLNVLNVDTKILILQSFILSHFMYCCTIWHFCSISDTKKIEKMQLKALRHIDSNRLVRLFHSCSRNVLIELGRSFVVLFTVVICGHIITRHHFLKFVLPITTCIVRFCMSPVAVAPAQCLLITTFPRLNA